MFSRQFVLIAMIVSVSLFLNDYFAKEDSLLSDVFLSGDAISGRKSVGRQGESSSLLGAVPMRPRQSDSATGDGIKLPGRDSHTALFSADVSVEPAPRGGETASFVGYAHDGKMGSEVTLKLTGGMPVLASLNRPVAPLGQDSLVGHAIQGAETGATVPEQLTGGAGSNHKPPLLPGAIVFGGENQSLVQDIDLIWDAANKRLGIGTDTPAAFLDIAAPTAEAANIRLGASAGVDPSSPGVGDLWFNGVNLFFQKDMDTAIDLLADGGILAIQHDGIALAGRSILNFTGGGVGCVDNAFGQRVDCSFERGVILHDVTYDELRVLVAARTLIPGDKYRLTDFRTRYTIPYTSTVYTGKPEVLVLTANGPDALDIAAASESYPQDIIHFTMRNDILNDSAVDRGFILYRKDTYKNVEAWEDFRNMVFRRWETEPGNGVYARLTESEAPSGAAYQDFPMFADYDNLTSQVSINHHRLLGSDKNTLSNIVFRAEAYKVSFPDGSRNATFLGNATNCSFGFCSSPTFFGDVYNVAIGENNRLVVYGALKNTYIRKRGISSLIIHGNLTNVEVLASFAGEEITGDYADVTFGAAIELPSSLAALSVGELLAIAPDGVLVANTVPVPAVGGESTLPQESLNFFAELEGVVAGLAEGVSLTQGILGVLRGQIAELGETMNSMLVQLSLNSADVAYVKEVIGAERVASRADISVAGDLAAETVEADMIKVKNEDHLSKTIGQAVICPEYFDVDAEGECVMLQIDSNNDFIEDMTGNRINDGKSAVVLTSAVSGNSRIFLTPRRVLDSPIAVTAIGEKEFFAVELADIVSEPVVFDWWIVEER